MKTEISVPRHYETAMAHTDCTSETVSEISFYAERAVSRNDDTVLQIIMEAQNEGWEVQPIASSVDIRRITFSSRSSNAKIEDFEQRLQANGFRRFTPPSHYPPMEACTREKNPVSNMKAAYNGVRRCIPGFERERRKKEEGKQ